MRHDTDIIQGYRKRAFLVENNDIRAGPFTVNNLNIADIDPGFGRLSKQQTAGIIITNGRKELDVSPETGQVFGDIPGRTPSGMSDTGWVGSARFQAG
jgi:hypothetical protein